jgi:hypothetical protein
MDPDPDPGAQKLVDPNTVLNYHVSGLDTTIIDEGIHWYRYRYFFTKKLVFKGLLGAKIDFLFHFCLYFECKMGRVLARVWNAAFCVQVHSSGNGHDQKFLDSVRNSVADPCHFGMDPDPDQRIHASD